MVLELLLNDFDGNSLLYDMMYAMTKITSTQNLKTSLVYCME